MRILTGIACGILWITFLAVMASKLGIQIDDNTVILTLAIVVAGGMAGGD